MKKIIPILLIIFLIISCGKEKTEISTVLVFDKPLNTDHYPGYFTELTKAFESDKCDKYFLHKYIYVSRIDIDKKNYKTNAWYFEKVGDNTVEFSNNWLGTFFKDSLVPKILNAKKGRDIEKEQLKKYIKKKIKKNNIYIYSENSDEEKFNEIPVFSDPKQLHKQIEEDACKLNGKGVIILVNPSAISGDEETGDDENDESDIDKGNGEGNTVKGDGERKGGDDEGIKSGNTIKIGNTNFTGGRNGKYHSGYATYFGGIKNGKADGQGTMVFKQKHLIPAPPYSNKRITAQKGYRLSGRFRQGYLNSGVLYDANGKRVRTVYIGR